jgi:uncharacterized membrane protein YphA (DoxX/SURF4 family)
MEQLTVVLQLVIGLGIANVWLLRTQKASAWRGGNSTTMREEFAVYGMPAWSVNVIGSLKLLCAAALIVGIWVPGLAKPAAAVLGVLMLGAVLMHVRVQDAAMRSLPAISLLVACALVVFV